MRVTRLQPAARRLDIGSRVPNFRKDQMTNPTSFEELLAVLPRGNFVGPPQSAFRIAEPVQGFVAPTLQIVERSDRPGATLISARGAMGKSTIARQLSVATQAPLWSLDADLSVSADALGSRLGRYIGPEDPVGMFQRSGEAFVIIDALDEGRLRVSGTSWSEYISSIAAVASFGHHFVLLGRERVLEDVWLSLTDSGIEVNWFEISHFDQGQRKAYVDGRVESAGRATDNEAYVAARDSVLGALEGTVAGPLSEAFVGYAPVLDAVVALLREGNLINVENTFASEAPDGERVQVLVDVLDSLLEREQGKTKPLAEDLGLEPAQAYAPDEQLSWLAAELLDADPPALQWCPTSARGEYAAQVQEFLRDHPFRTERGWASPVFSAYVAAKRFGDSRIRSHLYEVGKATGLLFEFVSHEGAAAVIDEWQFAALHSSLLAAEWQAVEAVVSIAGGSSDQSESDEGPEQATGELALLADGDAQRRTPFELILERPGFLMLLGPTSFLSVVFPATVVLGTGASVTLGPDCFVRCDELDLRAETVQILRRGDVRGASDDASVVLEIARRFVSNAALGGNPSLEIFELRVPTEQRLAYPWVLYRHELERPVRAPDDRAERFLKMLMRLVRRHGRSEMAVFDKKLEGRQSIKGDDFKNVLAKLEEMGVLSVAGPMILLNDEWAAQRFDGKDRPGQTRLDDKREVWTPVLDRISAVLQ